MQRWNNCQPFRFKTRNHLQITMKQGTYLRLDAWVSLEVCKNSLLTSWYSPDSYVGRLGKCLVMSALSLSADEYMKPKLYNDELREYDWRNDEFLLSVITVNIARRRSESNKLELDPLVLTYKPCESANRMLERGVSYWQALNSWTHAN